MPFVLAIIALIVGLGLKYGLKKGFSMRSFTRDLALFGVLAFSIAGVIKAITIVEAGHRVVVFDRISGVKMEALGEGFHLIIPGIQDTYSFDVRTQKINIKENAASKDMQNVTTELAIQYHPLPSAMPKIYQQFGSDYVDKIVPPAIQESLKAVTALYTAEELITKRAEVKVALHIALKDKLAESDLVLVDVFITDFKFSNAFAKAIENKQVQEQKALEAERKLEEVKFQADQKVETAKAEAESLRLQKIHITPNLLKLREIEVRAKAIEKWDGVQPRVVITGQGGSGLLLNVGGMGSGN